MRSTLADAARKARMGTARASIREFDDDHLMQQVKSADVYHSETPTDFERFQPVGMTAFPVKQQEDPNQKKSQQSSKDETGDWNHDQPTGPAAEAVMLYLNGSRSHPVAFVDDRRVRPYGMSEGEGAHYAPDGSEQMVLFKENGTYITSLDGPSVKDPKSKKTRFASLRHVNKKMQSHKIEKKQDSGASSGGGSAGAQATQLAADGGSGSGSQQQEKYKHEGDSVNTEVRTTNGTIEFYAPGDKKVGLYDKGAKRWFFDVDGAGNCTLEMLNDKMTLTVGGSKIEISSGNIKLTSPRIDHN
jgi:phage gp45-like